MKHTNAFDEAVQPDAEHYLKKIIKILDSMVEKIEGINDVLRGEQDENMS